jgi:hypothetical protein
MPWEGDPFWQVRSVSSPCITSSASDRIKPALSQFEASPWCRFVFGVCARRSNGRTSRQPL